MRYSFVIPTYENINLLVNSLEALNLLDYEKSQFEAIVIDDGSRLPSEEIIMSYSHDYSIQYHFLERTEKSSRSKARNHGISNAKGVYIIFIDADIIVKPDYLSELDRVFQLKEDCIVVGTRLMLREETGYDEVKNGSIFKKYPPYSFDSNLWDFRLSIFNDLSFNLASYKNPFIYGQTCNLTVPKKSLDDISGFDEDLIYWGVEDIELAYRLNKTGLFMVLNNRMEVLHQMHGNHGIFVEEDKLWGLNQNIGILLKKHPDMLPLNPNETFDFFSSIATRYRFIEQSDFQPLVITVDFTKKDDLDTIKELADAQWQLKGCELVIKDFVEETDLDLWIQLFCKAKDKVKYYPLSRLEQLKGCQ